MLHDLHRLPQHGHLVAFRVSGVDVQNLGTGGDLRKCVLAHQREIAGSHQRAEFLPAARIDSLADHDERLFGPDNYRASARL